MSLAWIVEECATPFGSVRTYNWGVPDENDDKDAKKRNASDYDTYANDTVGFGNDDDGEGVDPDEIALEPAQDQLGSVLWNSNTVALDHFCRFVVAQDNHDKNLLAANASPTAAKKLRTEEGSDDSDDDDDESSQEKVGKKKKGGSSKLFSSTNVSELTAAELAVSKGVLATKSVLELGAGVGVLGIALSLFGGAKSAITDIKELVPLMEKNIKESAKKVVPLPQHNTAPASSSASKKNNNNTNTNNKSKQQQQHQNAFATTIEGRGAKDAPAGERGGICRAYAFRWGEPMPQALSSFLGSRVSYVVMCDALYGNPSEWPKLIENLKEIVAIAKKNIAEDEKDSDSDSDDDNKKKKQSAGKKSARTDDDDEPISTSGEPNGPYSCYKSNKLPVIINYCEQRVDQVEGAFMKLLREKVPEWKIVGPSTLPAKSGMGMEVRVTAIYTR